MLHISHFTLKLGCASTGLQLRRLIVTNAIWNCPRF